jgi:hypothetical protein
MNWGRVVSGTGLGLAGVALSLTLGACSVPIADLPVIGLPAGAPTRSAEPAAYPAVHDMPAGRSEPVLDPAEQAKIENDLKMARNHQAGASTKDVDKASDR